MSHIEKVIARIPSMDARARAALRRNAEDKLAALPENANAQRVLDELDTIESSLPKNSKYDVTGLLAWEKYQMGEATPFRAFYGDQVVGRIMKRANHSGADKDVYSVEILERVIPGVWHHIADARAAGEAAFLELRDDTERRS